MAKTKYNWKPIKEMDLEDGTHTGYSALGANGKAIWLTQLADDTWDVERLSQPYEGRYITLVNCKTLTSAKRWAARYL